jgi:CubicO group peptidase (beta-lactamase class C family)
MKIKYLLSGLLFFIVITGNAQMDFNTIKVNSDALASKSDAAMLVLVDNGNDEMIYATGYSDKENKIKAKSDDLFEIGSASKMFTAIAVLQLIEEGKLSLKTTMNQLYPSGEIKNLANLKGKNYWDKITVEMLLNHSSGIIDYLNVYGDDEKAMKFLAVKGKVYTLEILSNLAIKHGDMNFIPGTTFKYSNTGYTLLGDIITKRSGMPWRKYIKKNVIDKSKMTDTYFGSTIPKNAESRKMKGYFKSNSSFMPPTLAGAAGEIVSNLKDLKKFLLAWQSGKLFSKPETLQMQHTQGYQVMYPEKTDRLTYGYGVMKIDGFYGHGGQTFGFQSHVAYNPEKKRLCVIGSNDAANIPVTPVFFMFEGITFD